VIFQGFVRPLSAGLSGVLNGDFLAAKSMAALPAAVGITHIYRTLYRALVRFMYNFVRLARTRTRQIQTELDPIPSGRGSYL